MVFDLDDTLYSESEYRNSGIKALLGFIETYYPHLNTTQLTYKSLLESDDFLALICKKLNLPDQIKESFLWVYRLHIPKIELSASISSLLLEIRKKADLLLFLLMEDL